MRELIAKPLGLVTQPNQVGLFAPGAMRRADGLRMRNPGELEPFKVNSQYVFGAGNGSYFVQRLFSTGSQILVFKNGAPYLTNSSFEVYWATQAGQNVAPHADSVAPTFFSSRVIPMLFRGRTLWNNRQGISVADYVNPTSTAERTARWAGLIQPVISGAIGQPADEWSVNNDTVVSYAALLRRTYADGYELVSAPSAIQRYRAHSVSGTPECVLVYVDLNDPTNAGRWDVRVGDVLELYRSREVASPTTGLNTESGTTLYKCASMVLTSGDLNLAAIYDRAKANEVVGDELYTNPGQETLQSARNEPPIAKCISSFKGYTFYSNVTLPGAWTFSVPAGLGTLPTSARALGIGNRQITSGTFTNGNPTVTGVSAADMVGIAVGQFVDCPNRTGNVHPPRAAGANAMFRIISKTATSFTMSGNAISTGAPSAGDGTFDAIEVDGNVAAIGDISLLLTTLNFDYSGVRYTLSSSNTLSYRDPSTTATPYGLTYQQTVQLRPSRQAQNGGALAIRATNGANYMPAVPEISATAQTFSPTAKPNYTYWSWEQQPECVPPGNYVPVGAAEIDAVVTTRDAQWFWCSDGLNRWTGYGTRPSGIQANWRYDLIDSRIRLASPTSYCVMNDEIFAYTNQGFVRVSDSRGIEYLSRGVIGDMIPGATWAETPYYSMAADPILNEVWLNIAPSALISGERTLTIVWNNIYSVFTVLNQRVGDDDNTWLTALEFAAQAGVVLLGVTRFLGGSGSGMIDWHDPAGTTYMAWTGDFQPLYGTDPMSSKQWVDLTVIFDSASAPKNITPRFNEIAGSYTNPTAVYPLTKDSRVSFGVPQTAPAIAALLVPGISGAQATGITRLRAISPRFSVFNEQQLVR